MQITVPVSCRFLLRRGISVRYAIMASLSKTLPFTCHWINKPSIDVRRQHLSALQSIVTNCSDLHFAALHMLDVRQKPSECIYEDPIQQVSCELAFTTAVPGYYLERVSSAIASQWCLNGLTDPCALGILQWLEPDRTSGFWRGFVSLEADIPLLSISFGAYIGLTTFAELYSIAKHTQNACFTLDCTFKHDEKVLYVCIRLQHKCKKTSSVYRLTLKYDDIYRVVTDTRVDTTDVYLHIKTVPLLHKQVEQNLEDILLSKSRRKSSQTCELMKFERTLDIGCMCTSYICSVDFARCPVLKLSMANKLKARQAVGRLSHRCRKDVKFVYAPVVTSNISGHMEHTKQKFMTAVAPLLQFSCRYALNAVFQQSHNVLAQMALLSESDFDAFLAFMQRCARVDEGALEQVLFALCASIENGSIFTLRTALPILFNKFHMCHTSAEIPSSCYCIRRVIATPSNLFLLPPEVHCKNRVLRSFDPDYALRVTFRDDNLDYLSHSLMFNQRTDEILEATVAAFLRKGIFIAGRHYRYLGSSASQLRDHGAWLYAKDAKGKSVQDIRAWMGDVAHIPNVGYKMARMGQCFSSTEDTVRVPMGSGVKRDLPDIVGGIHPVSENPYIFSDGIGMISKSLMTKVCEQLGLAEVPSAIQIRYAGYKGMLSLNPELQGDQLLLRESMNKFHCSTSDSLEIVRISAPRPVFLNRPLITILEQLGVPARVFLRLQHSMVLQLCDAFVNDDIALRLLCPHLSMFYLPLAKLHRLGLALTNEPFIHSLLVAVYNSAVAGLKNKSQIAVPEDTGRNMLGILDETGTLEYGQVFVQFSDIRNSERTPKPRCTARVLTGTVMVTKCPCLHPGDVRKFEAVDVPALRHIRDCIVFPAKGQRPHPDEMAGSDLDGDEYVVIAEEDLFFPGENVEPMVFNDQAYKADGQQDLDMISFTCNYIKNDNIGLMSSAHLAWADQLPDGIFSHRCLTLAEKISTSLDFAKTGISACLDKSERVHRYPEFMEKTGNKDTYQSSRVLGQLYRLNRGLVSSGFCGCAERRGGHNLFEFPGWQKHEHAARQAKGIYADIMSHILRRYGISSEAEVVTGLLSSLSPHHRSRNLKRNVETNVQKQFQKLVETMRQRFFRDVEFAARDTSLSGMSAQETLLQMGSAWYMVTRSTATATSEANCQGFPWCISDVLLVLLRSKRTHRTQTLEPQACDLLLQELNDAITKGFVDVPAPTIALNTLIKWVAKEGLLTKRGSEGPGICDECLSSLFMSFAGSGATTEQSPRKRDRRHRAEEGRDALFGHLPRNAAAYVMAFLRHLAHASGLSPLCRQCRQPCSQTHSLTLAALRCYSQLVVCGSPCHLGLSFGCDCQQVDRGLEEHGPIRVQVRNAALLRLLKGGGCVRVEETLRRWSGVQDVRIRLRTSRSGGRHCALVSARGRDWQLWFLEELLLQPWFEQAVVRGASERRPRH